MQTMSENVRYDGLQYFIFIVLSAMFFSFSNHSDVISAFAFEINGSFSDI